MKILTDHYFRIGSMHEGSGLPCQDYAYSGTLPNGVAYAVVSDGCSSSPDTDIGSRLLVHWFIDALRGWIPSDFPCIDDIDDDSIFIPTFVDDITWLFRTQFSHLDPQCLDATIVVAFTLPDRNELYISTYGDGVTAIRHKDGTVDVCCVEWILNAPPYLSYHINADRKENFITAYKANRDNRTILADGQAIVMRDGEDTSYNVINVRDGFMPHGILQVAPLDDVDTVAVFSDGISSFNIIDEENTRKMAMLFMDMKTFGGEFIKRTCMGTLKRLKKENLFPHDDFSMAAIKFLPDEV